MLLAWLFLGWAQPAQAITTGPNYAGAVGTNGWTNPANAVGSTETTCSGNYAAGNTVGFWKTFGFSIPAGDTIDGIQVEIKASWSGDPPAGHTINVGKSEATLGTAKSITTLTSQACGSGQTIHSFGGPTDKWGFATITPAELNSANFTVRLNRGTAESQFNINWIRVTVYHSSGNTTTLGNGTDPANTAIAPGGAATMVDAFTFVASAGTDSVTAATVTLGTGTSGGLSLVEITNNAGSTVYGSVANPASDTPSITLTTPIAVTTTATQYKIRITPKSHAAMPAPAGSSYAATARISAWTGTNAQAGSDTAGTTVTIDNLSPANVTGASATAGDTQVTVNWTNPGGDFSNVVILRNTATITDVPAEGSAPAVGATIGTSVVRYILSGTSFIDTGLTNGTQYFYRIFAKDTNGNYAATGVQVSATPAAPPPAAGGFNAYETSTGAGAISGVIKTKIAGATVSLDMIALNAAKTAIATTFTGTVRVEVLNASDNSGALDGNGCRPSWSVIQTLSPDPAFTDGRDPISFTQANSYPEARLRITFPAGAPTVTGCSNDNFAIRPATFNNVAAQDATWETAGNARSLANVAATGGNVHKAGRPFRITAQAINGAGSPAATINYSGSPVAVLTSLLQPSSGCGSCALGTLTPGTWSAASGVVTTITATYNEAGSFAMRLEDQGFAAVDAGDGSSTAERYIVGPSINVGRFVPERFVLSSSTTPQYRTFNAADAACQPPPSGPRRSFTYLGQPFGYVTAPSVTITAERFGGGTTANYSGNLWVATLNGPTYSNNAVGPALDTSLATSNLTVNNDGTATLAIGGSLGYNRSATTPIAPFNANLSITTDVSNSAENPAGNGIIGSSGALVFNGSGAGIAFDGGDFNLATDDGKTFVYGRARMQNASGPPASDLPIPFTVEHYTGTQFVANARDHCTSFVAGNFLLLDHSGGITLGNMPQSNISTSGSIVAGVGTLRLLKPTSPPATPGRVRICLDLGADAATPGTPACVATSAAQSWLQGRWSETNYDDDPSATAAFGLYGQPRNFIFFRENY